MNHTDGDRSLLCLGICADTAPHMVLLQSTVMKRPRWNEEEGTNTSLHSQGGARAGSASGQRWLRCHGPELTQAAPPPPVSGVPGVEGGGGFSPTLPCFSVTSTDAAVQ